MKNLILASTYEKDLKQLKKKHYALSGNFQGKRELHIESNWLLMYKSTDTEIILIRTGSHDDLYK